MEQPTPFYELDPSELERRVAEFRSELPSAQIFYAMKANAEPLVLRTLAGTGCGFECASWAEIEQVLGLGVLPDRIIYGTAVKPALHVERAVAAGVSTFAADSIEEVALLAALAPGCRVYVRMRADDETSVFKLSNKFGTPAESVVPLLQLIAASGLTPWGVSFNVGSQATRAEAWTGAIAEIAPLLEELTGRGITLSVLNLGGGFPAPYIGVDSPPFAEVAAAIRIALKALPYQPTLIVEPGRALVATSMSLVTSVVSRIERPTKPWLFLDAGVYNALFEALSCQGRMRYPVELADRTATTDMSEFVLTGPTGDALDLVDEAVRLPTDVRVGDRLRLRNVGAYTQVLASSFNGFPKPRVTTVATAQATGSSAPIDTRESRIELGFPETPTDWCEAPASFGADGLRIMGHPVMQDWERGYMEALADVATRNGGTVLELGYGLGLSAAAIQAREIKRHVVIECHPDVVARCLVECREAIAQQRMSILVGLWQEVTPGLADQSFDGILFDTYPLRESELHSNHFAFFKEAYRLLKPGGVLTYYSDEVERLSDEHLSKLIEAGFDPSDIDASPLTVSPPDDCEYWQANALVVPRVLRH